MGSHDCPYPAPGARLTDIQLFFIALFSWMHITNPAKTLAQGLAALMTRLTVMDPRVRVALSQHFTTAQAAGKDPFAISDTEFQELILGAVRNPNDVMEATQRFLRLSCRSCADIPHFNVTFMHAIQELQTLQAPFADGQLLVAFYIGMLPPSVRAPLIAANHKTLAPAIAAAATHAQGGIVASTSAPMELGHVQEEPATGAHDLLPQSDVARATEQLLAAITQRIATPQRTGGGAARGGRPFRSRLSDEERQRRSSNNLCMYCGMHRAGTFCQADADKKAAKSKAPPQGNE